MPKASTPQSLSEIQNTILSQLKRVPVQTYSKLRPKGVANDLFNYHLQFLVKKILIEKTKNGYSLTEKGIKHIADPIVDKHTDHLFKINVLTIVSRIKDGKIEIINQIRKNHPSIGKIGVPGGVVRKGETIETAAKRKLFEETGLTADFILIGTERRMMYLKNELFSDVLFPIAYSSDCEGDLIENSAYGQNLWVPIREAIKNESAPFDSIVSLKKILTAIEKKSLHKLPPFFIETTQTK
jgi:8-oxo-dGTP pyrophosphatase MutT (NUDIX family)